MHCCDVNVTDPDGRPSSGRYHGKGHHVQARCLEEQGSYMCIRSLYILTDDHSTGSSMAFPEPLAKGNSWNLICEPLARPLP